MELKEIQEFVKGRGILLVGNSESLILKDNSKFIDSYDVVVRMNHAVPQANIGFKTDIWLCSFINKDMQMVQFPKFNCKYNIKLNDDGNLNENLKNHFYIWPDKERDKIREDIGFHTPSTGVMAIYFFLNYCQCFVDAIGYDGFRTGTFYNGNVNNASRFHDVKKERDFLEKYRSKMRFL